MIRLLLVFLSRVINLPVSLCAGVALMEISEVHRKVHLELEENVSAKERWKQFGNCVASPFHGFKWQRPELVAQAAVPRAHASALSSRSSGLGCRSTCCSDITVKTSGTPQHALKLKNSCYSLLYKVQYSCYSSNPTVTLKSARFDLLSVIFILSLSFMYFI